MKGLGIFFVGFLAAASGIAAAAYIAKKKLERENEDDYFDAWDDDDDEDWDFDFDEENELEGEEEYGSVDDGSSSRTGSVFTEEPGDDASSEDL